MRIGTTPTHKFAIPFNTNMIRECQIVYQQNGREVLTKYLRDCKLEGNAVSVTLSQEETFLFDGSAKVDIQIRVVTANDDALASDIIRIRCDRCLSDEVLR